MNFPSPNWARASRFNSLILLLLTLVVVFFFAPIFPTFFLADDYNYVGHLLVHARQYIQGEQLGIWFIDFSAQGLQNPELSIFFRPIVQWLWLFDFVVWGTLAFGYHLTNIILHILNSFLVYILAWQILRHKFGAIFAGLFFALQPIHAESVSWIADRTDVLGAFFYLTSTVFFVLYRERHKRLFLVVSLAAFALAIGTKENTVALPLVLLVYDLLFTFPTKRWAILRAQIPYGIVLLVYVGLRFLLLGQFGTNPGGGFLSFGAELFINFYVLSLVQPFLSDMTNQLLLLFGIVSVILLWAFRHNKSVWFGIAWLGISLMPAAGAAYVAPRLVYAPSAGFALFCAAICVQPFSERIRWSRAVGVALSAIILIAFAFGLVSRVDDWAAAGTVARIIPEQTKKLYPTLPTQARVYFMGAPYILRGIYIYTNNFGSALQIAYRDPSLVAQNSNKFPIVSGDLSHSFFFEYRRRTVTERQDVLRLLRERAQCLAVSSPAITWNFSDVTQGWEAWNDLEPLQIQAQVLRTRVTGTDPYMASPAINIPSISLDDIEIEMQARAGAATTQGAIFWTTMGSDDFSPQRQQTFVVQTDGAFHTYRIDLARGDKLNVDDRVTRLRLDPTEVPAEIAIKSIRVNVHCIQSDGAACDCPR